MEMASKLGRKFAILAQTSQTKQERSQAAGHLRFLKLCALIYDLFYSDLMS